MTVDRYSSVPRGLGIGANDRQYEVVNDGGACNRVVDMDSGEFVTGCAHAAGYFLRNYFLGAVGGACAVVLSLDGDVLSECYHEIKCTLIDVNKGEYGCTGRNGAKESIFNIRYR